MKRSPRTAESFKAQHDPATIIHRLEAELAEARAQVGLEQSIREIIGTANAQIEKAQPAQWLVKPLAADAPGVPTLFLSDLHWGERVDFAEVNGVNEFNLAIARKRLKRTVDTAIHLLKILDSGMRYPGIVLCLGGDMISGNIHEELTATNELNTMPTLLDLWDNLVPAITLLADTFGKVRIPCVSGNHGRDTRKTWAKNRNATSFDWLLYNFMAKHFAADKRVEFFIPKGSDAQYSIYRTRYNLTHGDQFKAGDSIIGPLGPLMRGNQKKLARNQAVGQDYDVLLCGHWHQYIHLRRLIVNGSLKGYDEYAAQGNFSFEEPIQALWLTHHKYGITYRAPVQCDEPKSVAKPTEWLSVP